MGDALERTSTAHQVAVDQDKVLRSLGLDMRDPNVHAAIAVCQRYDLDPVLKHVVVVEGNPFITRDGLLHVAHQSGQLDGIVLEGLEDRGDEWEATVSVYRKDMGHPFRFPGRYPKMQQTKRGPRPHPYAPEMAVKCAESHALRRAFSVSGMGIADEIHNGTPIAGTQQPAEPVRSEAEERVRDMLRPWVRELDDERREHWQAWLQDPVRPRDWWADDAQVVEANALLAELLAQQGVEPFDIEDAEVVTDESRTTGRSGDEGEDDPDGLSTEPAAAGGASSPDDRPLYEDVLTNEGDPPK